MRGFYNGERVVKLRNDLLKLSNIHNAVLVMVYDEKTHTITFRIEDKKT